MISLENVTKVHHGPSGPVRALVDFDLEVKSGEFVAIRGPSGCGKSTLLSLAGGLAVPTSGRVRVDGEIISDWSASARAALRAQKIGFVFQLFHLLPYLSVRENVLVAALSDSPDYTSRAEKILNQLGLAERRLHRPAELSAGERQRAALARAMINSPSILLADEPTGNLDPDSAQIVFEFLNGFHQQGGAVLLVTHDDRAAQFAKRTIRLRAGRREVD